MLRTAVRYTRLASAAHTYPCLQPRCLASWSGCATWRGDEHDGGVGLDAVDGIDAAVSAGDKVAWRWEVGVHDAAPGVPLARRGQCNLHLERVRIECGVQIPRRLASAVRTGGEVSAGEVCASAPSGAGLRDTPTHTHAQVTCRGA